MYDLHEEKIIGRGRTAAVYDIGDGKILKLFYESFPRGVAKQECDIASLLNDSGLCAPRCYGSADAEGRFGIVYEKVSGPSLLQMLSDSPGDAPKIAATIARLQDAMHRVSVATLPDQKAELARAIDFSKEKLASRYQPILNRLDALEGGTAVCHGDFHPGNVIESSGAHYTIDWMTAVSGNPAGDVARTWLLLKSPFMPDDVSLFMRVLSGVIKNYFLKLWLREYLSVSGMSMSTVHAWLLPVAAARLRENVPGEEAWLFRLIDRELKS